MYYYVIALAFTPDDSTTSNSISPFAFRVARYNIRPRRPAGEFVSAKYNNEIHDDVVLVSSGNHGRQARGREGVQRTEPDHRRAKSQRELGHIGSETSRKFTAR